MSVAIVRRRFNVYQYHRMLEAGILSEDDRVELIAGEIVDKSPVSSRHAACVKRLNAFLPSSDVQAIVSIHNPIRLDELSEPEPDISLLAPREDYYADALPTADDVRLIVEVADSSLEFDREVKLPLSARAGIPEVWIVDLPTEIITIHRRPQGDAYQDPSDHRRGDRIQSAALANVSMRVEDVLS